jgi:hypothetical protein
VENELKKVESIGEVSVVLEKLSALLESAIEIQKQNRKTAIENFEYFSSIMKQNHSETETISEDGTLEKETNKAMSLILESSKALEKPIEALTKVLTTRMNSDALKSIGVVTKPIDINDFR